MPVVNVGGRLLDYGSYSDPKQAHLVRDRCGACPPPPPPQPRRHAAGVSAAAPCLPACSAVLLRDGATAVLLRDDVWGGPEGDERRRALRTVYRDAAEVRRPLRRARCRPTAAPDGSPLPPPPSQYNSAVREARRRQAGMWSDATRLYGVGRPDQGGPLIAQVRGVTVYTGEDRERAIRVFDCANIALYGRCAARAGLGGGAAGSSRAGRRRLR